MKAKKHIPVCIPLIEFNFCITGFRLIFSSFIKNFRNFLIEIPKSNSRHSFSANGNRSPIESAATPRRFSQQMDNLQENENERLYSEFDVIYVLFISKKSIYLES